MKALARWSASTLALATAGWIAFVLVAWLITPGGRAVIMLMRLAIQEHGTFAVELPLRTIRFWAVAAGLMAMVPSLALTALWAVARRGASKAAA
jgi:hypothetical protein